MTTSTRRLEVAVAVALALVGAFAIWQAASMPLGSAAMPGPGVMPMALGILLAAAGAVLAVRTLAGDRDAGDEIVFGHRRVALAVVAIAGAGLLLERAGFVVTSTAFLFVLLWSFSALGWWRSLLAAAVATLAARLLFQDLLNVALPALRLAS